LVNSLYLLPRIMLLVACTYADLEGLVSNIHQAAA